MATVNNGGFFSRLGDELIGAAPDLLKIATDKALTKANKTEKAVVREEETRSEAAQEKKTDNANLIKYSLIGLGGIIVLGGVIYLATRSGKAAT